MFSSIKPALTKDAKKTGALPKLRGASLPTIRHSRFLDSFDVYSNVDIPTVWAIDISTNQQVSFDPYKLHIRISAKKFLSVYNEINMLLYLAINSRTIKNFKVLDPEVARKLNDGRTVNSPYTIYLFHEYNAENAKKVAMLCLKIEKILRKACILVTDEKYIAVGELKLSQYFLFRMTTIDPNEKMYVPANHRDADLLIEFARVSEYYKSLSQHMAPKPISISAAASKYTLLPNIHEQKHIEQGAAKKVMTPAANLMVVIGKKK